MTSYEQIGQGYSRTRRADARIVHQIAALLSLPAGCRLLDIGAGTGNYSNALAAAGYRIVAVEPSATMRAQAVANTCVDWRTGCAEVLPVSDGEVEAAICVLAFHHFTDHRRALREIRRATGGGPILLFTFEPGVVRDLWLEDYFPEIGQGDQELFPPIASVAAMIEEETSLTTKVIAFPLPPDLTDLFLAAGWARPHVYLDLQVRAGISAFAVADQGRIAAGVERLRDDLNSGDWLKRYGQVLRQTSFEAGYRFIIAS